MRVIDEMCPTSLVDLKDKLFSAWKSITTEVTEKLVDSMPTRVNEVIRSRGGATRF